MLCFIKMYLRNYLYCTLYVTDLNPIAQKMSYSEVTI